jgi:hypothetical protein
MFCPALSTIKGMKLLVPLAALLLPLQLLLPLPADCAPGVALDRNGDGLPDQWYEVEDGQVTRLSLDRDYDERIDYLVEYDAANRKVREELDFNFDGRMDDFYFFEEGQLARQEVDSNFDGRIDVWVSLEGQYIRGYEMDRDFDGVAEVRKVYGP